MHSAQSHSAQAHSAQVNSAQVNSAQAGAARLRPSQVRAAENRIQVAADLSRYEKPREEPDDFRQRMLANIAAFAFTVALTAIGIWLAMSIADLRKTQDCVLMGRRDCVKMTVLPRS
ncbi:hypothetical protein [Bradyrhizobium genosp. L]|uniref:hypothetical protein n=1 Tax=Bradyrhizobium genosp. L TaxID=83637 RepID=UPI003D9BEBE7